MALRKCIFIPENYSERGSRLWWDHHWNYQQAHGLQIHGLLHFDQDCARASMHHFKNRFNIEPYQFTVHPVSMGN